MNKIKELFTKLKQKVLNLVEKVKNCFAPKPFVDLFGLKSLDVNNPVKAGEIGVPVPITNLADPIHATDCYRYSIVAVSAPKKKAKKKARRKQKNLLRKARRSNETPGILYYQEYRD